MRQPIIVFFTFLLAFATVGGITIAATTSITVNGSDTLTAICAKLTIPPVHPPAPSPVPTPSPTPPPVTSGMEKRVQIYDTFFGWPDNTPHNSSILSVGGNAGGDGTFNNPITAASGYVIKNGVDTLDYPYGTKFYVPNERKYFAIGDECGDPPNPESKPCHKSGQAGVPQIDLWVGGVGSKFGTSAGNAVDNCEGDHTRVNTLIFNPASNYVVVPGNVFTGSCGAQFGDTPVTI